MKNNLNDLISQAKRNNTQAMMEIIQRFEPKIKKSLHQTSFQNRDDLKQDLIIKFIEVVHNWDIEKGEMSL
ncbi:helix-turn-helix domain-containing protein [Paenibacillus taichungensis]|uniref:Helix-turn-helix domain-containing protein n=1 Tax=Paenibacillus taichungensis TaxID=484184 RepID=A0A329QDJ1_9BACL|nr:helix-turn-helix domain-containing protein [Paenibacillus taichungensis]RAW09749.1 helix-turn-helix domain-containing protein [Paenibacillus taichungensis]